MGGDIKVFSKKDIGTVFRISLVAKLASNNNERIRGNQIIEQNLESVENQNMVSKLEVGVFPIPVNECVAFIQQIG